MMSYEQWIKEHSKKHKSIMKKLESFTEDEIIDYFDFDNMVENEPDFCLLYKENKKCHDIKELNCYLCACPSFRLHKNKSTCDINSRHAKFIKDKYDFVHLDCTKCSIPHKKSYVKKHFHRDWLFIMKDVIIPQKG
jgi:Zn-finger protein